MLRSRPDAGIDEPALVCGISFKSTFLIVRYYFYKETYNPQYDAGVEDAAQRIGIGCHDGRKRCACRDKDPCTLKCPRQQEARCRQFNLAKSLIFPRLFDAHKQKRTQSQCPNHDRGRNQLLAKAKVDGLLNRKHSHRDVGQTAHQVEIVLCFKQSSVY